MPGFRISSGTTSPTTRASSAISSGVAPWLAAASTCSFQPAGGVPPSASTCRSTASAAPLRIFRPSGRSTPLIRVWAVNANSTSDRATSFGVRCRAAPLDQRDHPVEERLPGGRRDPHHDPVGQHPRPAGHPAPVAAGLPHHRGRLPGARRLVDRRHPRHHLPSAGMNCPASTTTRSPSRRSVDTVASNPECGMRNAELKSGPSFRVRNSAFP